MNIARRFSVLNISEFRSSKNARMLGFLLSRELRNICISQHGVLSALANEMKLILNIIHFIVNCYVIVMPWVVRLYVEIIHEH